MPVHEPTRKTNKRLSPFLSGRGQWLPETAGRSL